MWLGLCIRALWDYIEGVERMCSVGGWGCRCSQTVKGVAFAAVFILRALTLRRTGWYVIPHVFLRHRDQSCRSSLSIYNLLSTTTRRDQGATCGSLCDSFKLTTEHRRRILSSATPCTASDHRSPSKTRSDLLCNWTFALYPHAMDSIRTPVGSQPASRPVVSRRP